MSKLYDRVLNVITKKKLSAYQIAKVIGVPNTTATSYLSQLYFDGKVTREKNPANLKEYLYWKPDGLIVKPSKQKRTRANKSNTDAQVIQNLVEAIKQAQPLLKKYAKLSDLMS